MTQVFHAGARGSASSASPISATIEATSACGCHFASPLTADDARRPCASETIVGGRSR
jgi:hypothetical protein